MIKAAELMFKANEAKKPTVLLLIDRNELEDQMLRNLASLGVGNIAHANRITESNIFVLIDEAHRTRRRSWQLPDGRLAERLIHWIHRYARRQDSIRKGHLQDVRDRR